MSTPVREHGHEKGGSVTIKKEDATLTVLLILWLVNIALACMSYLGR